MFQLPVVAPLVHLMNSMPVMLTSSELVLSTGTPETPGGKASVMSPKPMGPPMAPVWEISGKVPVERPVPLTPMVDGPLTVKVVLEMGALTGFGCPALSMFRVAPVVEPRVRLVAVRVLPAVRIVAEALSGSSTPASPVGLKPLRFTVPAWSRRAPVPRALTWPRRKEMPEALKLRR